MLRLSWIWVAVAVSIAAPQLKAARILAFVPLPAKSHQRVIQPLLLELVNRGHHVTCYTPLPPDNPPKNYHAVKMVDLMPQLKKVLTGGDGKEQKEDYSKFGSKLSSFVMIMIFKEMGLAFTELLFKEKVVQDLFKSNEKFDAVIMETTFIQDNFIALGHKFNAPVIEFVPSGNLLWSYWLHGTPFDTSYIVDGTLPYTDKMPFIERLHNTFLNGLQRLVWYNYYVPKYQKLMDEHFRYDGWESRPPMMEMISNTSLVLINTHYSINYPYPYAPHVKEVGGLNIVKPGPLPKDLQDFMDSAKDGVIYFTLGSHIDVSTVLDDQLKEIFLQVFKELKQKVLWKWETEFSNLPSNIKVSKWFPQQDILAHKNIKLFITHGGLLSTTEAVYQGVPTVGIPVMADQYKNVAHMKHFHYGVPLHLPNITYASLKWAVNEILNNPEYSKNAKRQSELFRDKPESALETAIYWTEYVIRHKGAHHLRPAIATMPWYQQAMLDVYAAIALIVLLPIFIMYKLLKCIVNCILCRSSKKSKVQNKNKKNQ